jgi:hypothetical protein
LLGGHKPPPPRSFAHLSKPRTSAVDLKFLQSAERSHGNFKSKKRTGIPGIPGIP